MDNRLFWEFYPLVKWIAWQLVSKFPPNILVEDLEGYGTLGLIDALGKFTSNRQDSFRAYAELRIRGAILDHLRSLDPTPRSQRERQKKGLPAQLVEVAYIEDMKGNADCHQSDTRSPWEVLTDGEAASASDLFETAWSRQQTQQAIAALPDPHRRVMDLYFLQEITLKEIGLMLGVTESRVSQMKNEAMRSQLFRGFQRAVRRAA